jgi:hypothetical protein
VDDKDEQVDRDGDASLPICILVQLIVKPMPKRSVHEHYHQKAAAAEAK